ncbi:MAG: amidase [Caulobacteraceae bacterium]|nr:amidase [Caulobacteraceae bacterium]
MQGWRGLGWALGLAMALAGGSARAAAPYPVAEKSVAELQADMTAGRVTSEALVQAYLARIEAIDRSGPTLRSVIALNPHALEDALRLDAERRAGHVRGPLHGIPVLVKDNIETDDGTATTAGSLALKDNVTLRDAPVIRRLKDAGAVILGKTNLSEWANIRTDHSVSGWSGVGGLVKNPYVLDRNACGSSSGTGAAIAASLAAVGVGTETDGSVTCPAAFAALAGLKPTVGLVSRTHVVPISHSQDTPGPMGRSVEDVALLLTAMAGSDPADAATAGADAHRADYAAGLAGASLKGRRLGVLSFATGFSPTVDAVFAQAVAQLKAEGAEVVELKDYRPPESLGDEELAVLMTELKADLNAYLATTPPAVKTRTLAEVIAFNRASPREMALIGQELFELAEATKGLDDPAYLKARADSLRQAGAEGIDRLLADNRLDALIAPSYGPAYRIDVGTGDHDVGSSSTLAAVAGYPHLTVPMGQIRGLPVGISFIGPAWSEARLLALGAAYERAAEARRPPAYVPSLESAPEVRDAMAPAPR